MLKSIVISAVLGASFVSAQSLSTECRNTLTGLTSNPDASACLSPNSLLPLFLSANTSIIEPVNNWLTSVCSAAPCRNETLAAVVTNVTQGCSAELTAFGYSSADSAGLTSIVQQGYPTVRQIVCLRDGDTNCITKSLRALEQSQGTLSIASIPRLALSAGRDLPKDLVCSNCSKEIWNVLNRSQPGLVTQDERDIAKEQCGDAYLDGQTPAGITQSATNTGSNNSNNNNNGVARSNSFGFSGLALVLTALGLFT